MVEHARWWPAGVALLFCLTTAAALVAAADGDRGTVVIVAEGQVGLELAGGNLNHGSAVEILYATPDGDEISCGLWCIDKQRESARAGGARARAELTRRGLRW